MTSQLQSFWNHSGPFLTCCVPVKTQPVTDHHASHNTVVVVSLRLFDSCLDLKGRDCGQGDVIYILKVPRRAKLEACAQPVGCAYTAQTQAAAIE
jgi:hypothetical protein